MAKKTNYINIDNFKKIYTGNDLTQKTVSKGGTTGKYSYSTGGGIIHYGQSGGGLTKADDSTKTNGAKSIPDLVKSYSYLFGYKYPSKSANNNSATVSSASKAKYEYNKTLKDYINTGTGQPVKYGTGGKKLVGTGAVSQMPSKKEGLI